VGKGTEAAKNCVRCGLCRRSCLLAEAWPPGGEVATPRGKMILLQEMLAGVLELDEAGAEEFWYRCTTCGRCELDCPALVPLAELVIAVRRYLVERGRVPSRAAHALRRLRRYGNPWGRPAGERWAGVAGLPAKPPAPGEAADTLLYLGCLAGYDPRARRAALALAEVLAAAGLNFAVLGAEELCCGGEAYALGEEGLFEHLAEANLALFARYRVRRIIAFCPHCYHAFKALYPRRLEVKHYTEVLAELVEKEKIPLRPGSGRKVVYHDPCHLGRRHGIYRAPRQILRSLPKTSLLAAELEAEEALCCEAGGGRMWLDPPGGKSLLPRRIVDQAQAAGADTLAVTCPFCLTALEPPAKERGIAVQDLAEMVRLGLGRGD